MDTKDTDRREQLTFELEQRHRDEYKHFCRLRVSAVPRLSPFRQLDEANRHIGELQRSIQNQLETIDRLKSTVEPGTVLVIQRQIKVPVEVVQQKVKTVQRVVTKNRIRPVGYQVRSAKRLEGDQSKSTSFDPNQGIEYLDAKRQQLLSLNAELADRANQKQRELQALSVSLEQIRKDESKLKPKKKKKKKTITDKSFEATSPEKVEPEVSQSYASDRILGCLEDLNKQMHRIISAFPGDRPTDDQEPVKLLDRIEARLAQLNRIQSELERELVSRAQLPKLQESFVEGGSFVAPDKSLRETYMTLDQSKYSVYEPGQFAESFMVSGSSEPSLQDKKIFQRMRVEEMLLRQRLGAKQHLLSILGFGKLDSQDPVQISNAILQNAGNQPFVHQSRFKQVKSDYDLMLKKLVARLEGLLRENKGLKEKLDKSSKFDGLIQILKQQILQLRKSVRSKDQQIYHLKGLCLRSSGAGMDTATLQKDLAYNIAEKDSLRLQLLKKEERIEMLTSRLQSLDPSDKSKPVEQICELRNQNRDLVLQLKSIFRQQKPDCCLDKRMIDDQKLKLRDMERRLGEETAAHSATRAALIRLEQLFRESEEKVATLVAQLMGAQGSEPKQESLGQLYQVLAQRTNSRRRISVLGLYSKPIQQLLEQVNSESDSQIVTAALVEHSPFALARLLMEKCKENRSLWSRLEQLQKVVPEQLQSEAVKQGRQSKYAKLKEQYGLVQYMKGEVDQKERLVRRLIYNPTAKESVKIEVEQPTQDWVAKGRGQDLVGTAVKVQKCQQPESSICYIDPRSTRRLSRIEKTLTYLSQEFQRKQHLLRLFLEGGGRSLEIKCQPGQEESTFAVLRRELTRGELRRLLQNLHSSLGSGDGRASARIRELRETVDRIIRGGLKGT